MRRRWRYRIIWPAPKRDWSAIEAIEAEAIRRNTEEIMTELDAISKRYEAIAAKYSHALTPDVDRRK